MGWTREVLLLHMHADVLREAERERMQELRARCETRPYGSVENVQPVRDRWSLRSGWNG